MNTNNTEYGEGKLVIGLTGGIGTGKSTAAEYLVSKGMTHIDADAISRKITEKTPGEENPVLMEIGEAFAPEPVLREDGSVPPAGEPTAPQPTAESIRIKDKTTGKTFVLFMLPPPTALYHRMH